LRAVASNDRFSGKASGRMELTSTGKNQQALVSNADGGGTLRIVDGSVKGLDIASMVRNVKSAFMNIDTAQQKTDFAEVAGSFRVKNGIVSNNDLAMKAPLFRVSGKGNVDVPNYRIDYRLTPQMVDTLKGQGGKDKAGLGVPIRISGSLENPSYAPDVSGMVDEAIKNPAKFKENIKDVKKAVKGLLKGL